MMTRRRPLHMTWEAAIRIGRERGHPAESMDVLSADSYSWLHCAVGEKLGFGDQTYDVNGILHEVLEHHHPQIYELGIEFNNMVDFENWDRALDVYEQTTNLLTPEVIHLIRVGVQSTARIENVQIATMRLPHDIVTAVLACRQAAGTGGVAA